MTQAFMNDQLPVAELRRIPIPALSPNLSPAEIVAILIATMCREENDHQWAGFRRSAIEEFAKYKDSPAIGNAVPQGIASLRTHNQVVIARSDKGAQDDIVYPTQRLIYVLFEATSIAAA